MWGLLASALATGAAVGLPTTDFGIRVVGASASKPSPSSDVTPPVLRKNGPSLQQAAAIGARWGRVTSTFRSAAHNRQVGGVPNSWHLRGRAMDIARRRGVTHAQLASALRAAGYFLIESLDEGDHSHFAFGGSRSNAWSGSARAVPTIAAQVEPIASELTDWGIVTVSSRRGGGMSRR